MDQRQTQRHAWLNTFADRYGLKLESEASASADASFRQYVRQIGRASCRERE